MAAPGMPLLRVEQTGPLRLDVRLDESRAGAFRTGQAVEVRFDAGVVQASAGGAIAGPVMGRVTEIARAAEAGAHAFLVKIELPADDIVERTFLSEFEGSKAFYDLLSRGLIEEARRTGVVDETGTFSVEMPVGPPAAAGRSGRPRRWSSSGCSLAGLRPPAPEPRERLHGPAAEGGGRGRVPEGRLPLPAPPPVGGDRRLLPDAGPVPRVPGGDRQRRAPVAGATSSTPGAGSTGTSSRTTPGSTTSRGSTPKGRPIRTSSSPTSSRGPERRGRSSTSGKKEIIIIK